FRKTLAPIGRRSGLDHQFVQAILGHETVTATLDYYAQVDVEDVKREYAKLDLLGPRHSSGAPGRAELIESLRPLAPTGKEHAWEMHIEGLVSLAGDKDSSGTTLARAPIFGGHGSLTRLARDSIEKSSAVLEKIN